MPENNIFFGLSFNFSLPYILSSSHPQQTVLFCCRWIEKCFWCHRRLRSPSQLIILRHRPIGRCMICMDVRGRGEKAAGWGWERKIDQPWLNVGVDLMGRMTRFYSFHMKNIWGGGGQEIGIGFAVATTDEVGWMACLSVIALATLLSPSHNEPVNCGERNQLWFSPGLCEGNLHNPHPRDFGHANLSGVLEDWMFHLLMPKCSFI